jgi:flagellar assembly protein FliH
MGRQRRTSRIVDGIEDPRKAFPPECREDEIELETGPDPVEEAYNRGKIDGIEEGRQQAMLEMQVEIEKRQAQLAEAVRHLADLEENLTREHESRLLEITLEAASRIVRNRIEQDDPVAVRALREAMESLPEPARLKVRIHPEDVEIMTKTMADELAREKLELSPDETVSRGGCVVETPVGNIDATLETAERAVRQAATGEDEES